jgi:tRNA1Val (adenine37-N6)-methyltransferase
MKRSADESVDAVFGGRLWIAQRRDGYRFSIDALLLAHFVTVRAAERIVDIGSGNGVIALALAFLHRDASVTGIELQRAMVERARRSARWNGLGDRVRFVHGDVRGGVRQIEGAGEFDVAVCNPPYRRCASGRVSANDERRAARHEIHGELADFLGAAARLVGNKGRAALIHLAARSADVMATMRQVGLEPKRLRMIHSDCDAEASLVLVEGVRNGRTGLTVLRPLILYDGAKNYSAEAAAILAGGRE